MSNSTNGWAPIGVSTQLPPGDARPLAANEQGGLGQLALYDASGNVEICDGATPGLLSAGVVYPNKLSETSAVAGAAEISLWQGMGSGAPSSEETNDTFLSTDLCTPAWGASADTIGKLSNFDGDNRSLVGLVLGLTENVCQTSAGLSVLAPILWSGQVAQAIARAVMMASAYPFAEYNIADAAASTTIAERVIGFAKVHGPITSVKFSGAAVAADGTDYAIVTISKRSLATDYGTAVSVAVYNTQAAPTGQGAITAFVPASFLLSVVAGALNLLETDILTITTTKASAGKTLTGTILINGKAL